RLTFKQGRLTGDGRDCVGLFVIHGRYSVEDGKCHWSKRYLGRHDVFYQGFNEGKGIWGRWEISADQNRGVALHGGFHIWPEGMPDGEHEALHEEADVPIEAEAI